MQSAVDRNGAKGQRLLLDCLTFEESINSAE